MSPGVTIQRDLEGGKEEGWEGERNIAENTVLNSGNYHLLPFLLVA